MFRKRNAVLPLVVIAVLLALADGLACADEKSPRSAVVSANTRFAFKFFKSVVGKTSSENVLVAPTGLSLTFALLANEADVETRKELENTFGFGGPGQQTLNLGFSDLREALGLNPPPKMAKRPVWMTPSQWRAYQTAPPNGTVIADSFWSTHGLIFPAVFLDTAHRYYGMDIRNFLTAPSPSMQVSNWARQRIKKAIDIHIDRPATTSDFLFVDVTYFHSFWEHRFEESATNPGPFTLLNGRTKQVSFMNQRRDFRYFEDADFQAVVLPYGTTSMYVFLPSETSNLTQFERLLSAEKWQEWLSRFESRPGHLGFPRFEVATNLNVRSALQGLGLQRAFKTLAAFPLLAPEGAKLSSASQNTSLKVDEQGTEAISVGLLTGVVGGVMGGRMGPPPKPFEMIVNRPFFFAIADDQTKQLLFMGAVVEP